MIRTNGTPPLARAVSASSSVPVPQFTPSVQCILSDAELRKFHGKLRELCRRSRHPDAPMALPRWMEARRPAPGWSQRTILLRTEGVVLAAVFLQECTPAGMPSGYFRGYDALGDTLILCDAGREKELLQQTIDLLLARHRAFLVVTDRPAEAPVSDPPHVGWRFSTLPIERRWYHPLRSTLEETMALFGRRTRCNLRYALRRVERNGWHYHSNLSPAQVEAALAELASTSTHPFDHNQQQTRLHLARTMDDAFTMGLTDSNGRWLSCVIGRRTPEAAEIFWQSNARSQGSDSLCTTMRALFMRGEIARGTREVRYIGGTTQLMQHCCSPAPGLQTVIGRPGLRLSLLRMALKTTAASPTNDLHRHF